ncbi:SdrH family protein [Staphylococcus chromogenes]|uniref:SdrH family protein n=1 Tax=Staphylococcus chromogenes TaxID=46126 RepID=UPI0021D2C58E|nr:SdrH family protein [Staphylococcus chromogenes]
MLKSKRRRKGLKILNISLFMAGTLLYAPSHIVSNLNAEDSVTPNNTSQPTVQSSTEEPSTEQPSTEEPSTEQPSTEESSTEQPSTEEPSTEQPSTEEPSTEQPSTEEPSTEQPSTEEPSTEQPSTEEPSTEQPSTEEPSTEQPSTEEPSTEQPSTEEPSTEQPSTEQPPTPGPSQPNKPTSEDGTSRGPQPPSGENPGGPNYPSDSGENDASSQNHDGNNQQPYDSSQSGNRGDFQNATNNEPINRDLINNNFLLPSYYQNNTSTPPETPQGRDEISSVGFSDRENEFNPLSTDRYYQNLDRKMLALITGEIGALPDDRKMSEKTSATHHNDDKVREINQNGENLEAKQNGNGHNRTREGLNFLKYIGIGLASLILIAGFSYLIWRRIKNGN